MWKCAAAQHYADICKQLLISNDRNMVRWVVLGLSEDGACTDLFENLIVNSLKGGLSNATTFNPPLFSLVNTFKKKQTCLTIEEISNLRTSHCVHQALLRQFIPFCHVFRQTEKKPENVVF